jgi:hypothetical protein
MLFRFCNSQYTVPQLHQAVENNATIKPLSQVAARLFGMNVKDEERASRGCRAQPCHTFACESASLLVDK